MTTAPIGPRTALDPQDLCGEPRARATALMAAKDALYPTVRVNYRASPAELTMALVDLAEYVVNGAVPGLPAETDEPEEFTTFATGGPIGSVVVAPCPECRAGKHSNCTRTVIHPTGARFVDCPCIDLSH